LVEKIVSLNFSFRGNNFSRQILRRLRWSRSGILGKRFWDKTKAKQSKAKQSKREFSSIHNCASYSVVEKLKSL
jgi:hypothetical protein